MEKTKGKFIRTLAKIGRGLIIILIIAAAIHFTRYFYLQNRDGGGHCAICLKTHVVHSYETKVGLMTFFNNASTPEAVVKLKGEPLRIVEKSINDDGDMTEEYVYDGLSVVFCNWSVRGKWIKFKFTVYDPTIKFSRTVHVGSTRAEIIEAYKHVIAEKEYALGEGYFDIASKDYNYLYQREVTFTYDENDIVTSITYIYKVI